MPRTLGSIAAIKALKLRTKVTSKEGRKPLHLPVLDALAQGPATDRQIAKQLGISPNAAKGQLDVLCLKEYAEAHPPNARHPKFKITTTGREELRRHRAFGRPGKTAATAAQLVV
jgi:predicted ArsR family transcriptional regulator